MPDSGQVIYFHGMPGSSAELKLFGPEVAARARGFHVLDRNGYEPDGAEDYWQRLASSLEIRFPGQELHFVGFSLGAMAALRVAAILRDEVKSIALVSPAAPLQIGSYLATMAGAPVFRTAQDKPVLFALQCRLQSYLARFSAPTLARLLFASARGADAALWEDQSFRRGIANVLRQGVAANRAGYQREIRLYVQDWTRILAEVRQPVTIDHGALDNWSPVAMGHDLARRLPNYNQLTVHSDLSHYSTLKAWLIGHRT